MSPLVLLPIGLMVGLLAVLSGSSRARTRPRRRGLPPEILRCIAAAKTGQLTVSQLTECAQMCDALGYTKLAARFRELALAKEVEQVTRAPAVPPVVPAAPIVPPVVAPTRPPPPPVGPPPPARPAPPGVTRVEPPAPPPAPVVPPSPLRPPREGTSVVPKESPKLAPDDFQPERIVCSAPDGRAYACRATGRTKGHLKNLQRAINKALEAFGMGALELGVDGAIGAKTVKTAAKLTARVKFEGSSVTARILRDALQPPTPEKMSRAAPVLTKFFAKTAKEAQLAGAAKKALGWMLDLTGAGKWASSGEGVGSPLVTSPWPDVSDDQWERFLVAMARARVSSVSPSYGLGLFHYDARQLERLGLVDNVRAGVPEPIGDYAGDREVWVGDWVPPNDAEQFLSDGTYQIEVFSSDMATRRGYIESLDAIGEMIAGKPATLSGLLAVAKYAGDEGLVSWLSNPAEREQYPHTTAAYQRTTGIF